MIKNDEWAEEEIKLAKEQADEYGKACLDAAYEAYKNLQENGHTGYTVGTTREILMRLLEGKPLTAIKDFPDIWEPIMIYSNYVCYQCKRMPALYKYVFPNGDIEYRDVSRVFIVDIVTGDTYKSNTGYAILNKVHPIEMPYYPPLGYFKIYCESGNYTEGIKCKYMIEPDGNKVELDINEGIES